MYCGVCDERNAALDDKVRFLSRKAVSNEALTRIIVTISLCKSEVEIA